MKQPTEPEIDLVYLKLLLSRYIFAEFIIGILRALRQSCQPWQAENLKIKVYMPQQLKDER